MAEQLIMYGGTRVSEIMQRRDDVMGFFKGGYTCNLRSLCGAERIAWISVGAANGRRAIR